MRWLLILSLLLCPAMAVSVCHIPPLRTAVCCRRNCCCNVNRTGDTTRQNNTPLALHPPDLATLIAMAPCDITSPANTNRPGCIAMPLALLPVCNAIRTQSILCLWTT